MGMFKVRVQVKNSKESERSFSEDFWVDTGAIYTLVPAPRLRELGVEPSFSRELTLADGSKQTRDVGEARLRIEGFEDEITCLVVFAPDESLFLLGATALENFSLAPDPVNRRLKSISAIIGGFLASGSA